ncbi:NUDIX hydrolase [uncultured Methylobacterium sp.]|uniref:NUDIX domain-containing protein n=1 Tax=uncultured Methylobacterium sp. TaxID=157278 RepID=UPI00261817E9|nr:NUDIX hydrolase [uncultured Methylobacterium sp.]
MTTDAPRIRATRVVHAGWARYLVADVVLPDGASATREIEDHGRAVAVLPYDPVRRTTLMVRQFRAPPCLADGTLALLEAPAGRLEEDDPETCARREAHEETGLRLGALEPAGWAWTMPGISTERIDYYLAPYAADDRVAAGGGLASENEQITVVELSLAEAAARSNRGEIVDLKTLYLLQTLRLRRPDLFAAAG